METTPIPKAYFPVHDRDPPTKVLDYYQNETTSQTASDLDSEFGLEEPKSPIFKQEERLPVRHCKNHTRRPWPLATDKKPLRLRLPLGSENGASDAVGRWCPFRGRPPALRWAAQIALAVLVLAVLATGVVFGAFSLAAINRGQYSATEDRPPLPGIEGLNDVDPIEMAEVPQTTDPLPSTWIPLAREASPNFKSKEDMSPNFSKRWLKIWADAAAPDHVPVDTGHGDTAEAEFRGIHEIRHADRDQTNMKHAPREGGSTSVLQEMLLGLAVVIAWFMYYRAG